MRFSAAIVFVLCTSSANAAFQPRPAAFASRAIVVTSKTTSLASTTTESSESAAASAPDAEQTRRTTKKDKRLTMMKSDKFHRKGFKEVRDSVEKLMETQFQSPLVKEFRSSNYMIEKDGVKVYLAKVRNSEGGNSDCFELLFSVAHTLLTGNVYSPFFLAQNRILVFAGASSAVLPWHMKLWITFPEKQYT